MYRTLQQAPRPRVIVTGCQRSATGYTASLLTALGCPCGHETVFNPRNLMRESEPSRSLTRFFGHGQSHGFLTPAEVRLGETLPWPEPLRADSSWLAAPYLAALPRGTVVLHQVRDAIAVIRSMMRIRFFDHWSPFRSFAEAHCPSLEEGTVLERCIVYWTEWNRIAQKAELLPHVTYVRYRIEDLTPPALQEILTLIGCRCDTASLAGLLRSHPRDINTRNSKRRDHLIRWETLPPGEARRDCERLAAAYGYTPAMPDRGPMPLYLSRPSGV